MNLLLRFLSALLREPPFRLGMRTLSMAAFVAFPGSTRLFRLASEFDGLGYMPYAVGLQEAARSARHFGYDEMTAIEFGVAGGTGLLFMAKYAELISRYSGVRINVVGFDSGTGLPASTDSRDHIFDWRPGDFPCDVELLRSKLPLGVELFVGRIQDTLPRFLADVRAPIGFAAVDVDYYTSTMEILDSFATADRLFPAVGLYFDDTLFRLMSRFEGEALAISDFNANNALRKIDHSAWIGAGRAFFEKSWLQRMFTLYSYDMPFFSSPSQRQPKTMNLVESRSWISLDGRSVQESTSPGVGPDSQ
jgi:hypothetical protein